MDVEITRPMWLLALPVLAVVLVWARVPWWWAGLARGEAKGKIARVRLLTRRTLRGRTRTTGPGSEHWERSPVATRAEGHGRSAGASTVQVFRAHVFRAEVRRLAIRLGWLALPVLALAGLTVARPLDQLAVVFVTDQSASVAAVRDRQEAAVRAALAALRDRDVAGVVAAGAEASVQQPLSRDPLFDAITGRAAGASDLARGIALAAGLVPADRVGRVVVLTDGRETSGDAVAAARVAADRGISVDVFPVGPDSVADLRLDRVQTPATAREGESSVLRVAVTAGRATTAVIRVYRDDALALEQRTEVRAGEHELALALPPAESGVHRLRVEVAAERVSSDQTLVDGVKVDTTPLNNVLGAVQRVLGPPRVLIIAAPSGKAGFLPAALEAGGARVRVTAPSALPAGLAAMAAYDGVVLADVPAAALPAGAMELLERYVRELGRGLVMTGGPDAFAPGGYAGTPVEEALPVYMDLRGRGREPRVALVLVIDRSGSMQGLKMEMAKEAAVRTIRLLKPEDQAGVIVFDVVPQWVGRLAPVGDGGWPEKAVGPIYAGGGTEIFPAVAAAFEALREAEADVKHMIVLTDGHSASGGNYARLLELLREEQMTLSSIAVGDDADRMLLAAMARGGRGRAHVAADPSRLPEIFTEETVMATRTILVDGRFFPAAASAGPLLRGIERVAVLDGYVAVTPKERAEVVLVSPEGDPVLAAWQYGAGRAIAWTPDLGGRWSSAWAGDEGASRLWGNALSWLLPPPDQGELVARVGPEADGFALLVENRTAWDEIRPTAATLLGPAGRQIELELSPAGPGRYRARLPELDVAAYVIRVHQQLPSGDELRTEIGWAAPYPAEYRAAGIDRTTLARIAEAGGGQVLDEATAAVRAPDHATVARWPLAPLLLVLAAIAWPLEIASRRLPRPSIPAWLRRWLIAIRNVSVTRRATTPAPAWLRARIVNVRKASATRRATRPAPDSSRQRMTPQSGSPDAPATARDNPVAAPPRPQAAAPEVTAEQAGRDERRDRLAQEQPETRTADRLLEHARRRRQQRRG